MRDPKFLEDKSSRLGPSNKKDKYSDTAFLDLINLKKLRRINAFKQFIGSGGYVGTNTGAMAQFPPSSINPVVVEYLVTEDGFGLVAENGIDNLIV